MQPPNPSTEVAACDNVIRLVPIAEDDHAIRAVLAAQLLPQEQQRFAATALVSLPLGDADPGRLSVAILAGTEPVGMFALDRGGYFREFEDDAHAVLLRGFYIAHEHQGRGHAGAAVAQLADFVREQLPDVRRVVLTVNHENPTAVRTYLAGGFVDTGEDYQGGAAGPQHVFQLTL